jgi:hypothetical protein
VLEEEVMVWRKCKVGIGSNENFFTSGPIEAHRTEGKFQALLSRQLQSLLAPQLHLLHLDVLRDHNIERADTKKVIPLKTTTLHYISTQRLQRGITLSKSLVSFISIRWFPCHIIQGSIHDQQILGA